MNTAVILLFFSFSFFFHYAHFIPQGTVEDETYYFEFSVAYLLWQNWTLWAYWWFRWVLLL